MVLKSKLERLQNYLRLQRRTTEIDIEGEISWMSFLDFGKQVIIRANKSTRARLGFSPAQSMSNLFDGMGNSEAPSRRLSKDPLHLDLKTDRIGDIKRGSINSNQFDSSVDKNSEALDHYESKYDESDGASMLREKERSKFNLDKAKQSLPQTSSSRKPIHSRINASMDMTKEPFNFLADQSKIGRVNQALQLSSLTTDNKIISRFEKQRQTESGVTSPQDSRISPDKKFTQANLRTNDNALEAKMRIEAASKKSVGSLFTAGQKRVEAQASKDSPTINTELLNHYLKKQSVNVTENNGSVIVNINSPTTSRIINRPDPASKPSYPYRKQGHSPRGIKLQTSGNLTSTAHSGGLGGGDTSRQITEVIKPTSMIALQRLFDRQPRVAGITSKIATYISKI